MGIGIDASRIDAMVSQLKQLATRVQGAVEPLSHSATGVVEKPNFNTMLKTQLDQVNEAQMKAESLGQRFSTGDDNVSLADVMIASQKANIGLQATIQVRNKLVSAYNDIISMQV